MMCGMDHRTKTRPVSWSITLTFGQVKIVLFPDEQVQLTAGDAPFLDSFDQMYT